MHIAAAGHLLWLHRHTPTPQSCHHSVHLEVPPLDWLPSLLGPLRLTTALVCPLLEETPGVLLLPGKKGGSARTDQVTDLPG